MKKTLGGDRLGSGKKMQVELHGYERSTHDLGYIWRSTMSSGTLVPFMEEYALPGDTFDINLNIDVKTHPTIGPLFGSYKIQLDLFQAPIRLYQGLLHNNALGIGMMMNTVKLPVIELTFDPGANIPEDFDNSQINPSCILAYLGIRGIGMNLTEIVPLTREFNGTGLLAYWDIYKNYYANKQEEIGAVIHSPRPTTTGTVLSITYPPENAIPQAPAQAVPPLDLGSLGPISIACATEKVPLELIVFVTQKGIIPLSEIMVEIGGGGAFEWILLYDDSTFGTLYVSQWRMALPNDLLLVQPKVSTFPLTNIDEMRNKILQFTGSAPAFSINLAGLTPYQWVCDFSEDTTPSRLASQEGLAIKTYQSDLFNNWLQTEWIDGPSGISEITAIDTSDGSFTIDTLNLSRKVYDMLNRIAVSGGSYDDWLDAVYTHDRYTRCESPIYHGGLIKELVFQEVVSNSASPTESGEQPLGTLAGKGVMGKKHKGGHAIIKVDEPSILIGIISLTPRIDYSQGNKWHVHLKTMDDFHKPALDEIGFQELTTEQMAWWSTQYVAGVWTTKSAGKQPAWINYMTNINRTYGNFAISDNEMFMTLNRRYERDITGTGSNILDLTTYIDPVKFNNIFAETSLDAQNFWVQIAVDITARRKMSARVMPNL